MALRFAIAVLFLAVIPMGCASTLENVCIEATPTIYQGNVLVNNAQTALLQAESAIQTVQDPAVKQKAIRALEDARKGLRTAEELLHVASEACEAADVPRIIQVLADAWRIVRPFLGTHGGSSALAVKDPIAYSLNQTR